MTVATESLSVLGTLVAQTLGPVPPILFAALCAYLLGEMFYILFIALIVYRASSNGCPTAMCAEIFAEGSSGPLNRCNGRHGPLCDEVPFFLTYDQHWTRRKANDPFGCASEEEMLQASIAMSSDYD